MSAQAHCEARLGVTAASFGLMLARILKADIGPALERQLQIHARAGQINQIAIVIERQVIESACAELLELARILRRNGLNN